MKFAERSLNLASAALLFGLSFHSAFGAGRDGTRGGGDPLALEFKGEAEAALKNLQSLTLRGAPFSTVNLLQLQNEIDSAKILVSSNPLPISEDGIIQNGAAENVPDQNLIIIDSADFSKISSPAMREALALHEYLSLLGTESTGRYPISGAYLAAESDKESVLNCVTTEIYDGGAQLSEIPISYSLSQQGIPWSIAFGNDRYSFVLSTDGKNNPWVNFRVLLNGEEVSTAVVTIGKALNYVSEDGKAVASLICSLSN